MKQSEIIRDILNVLETIDTTEIVEDKESIKQQIQDVTTQIERIVDSGGRVSLTDPLSKRLRELQAKLKAAK